MTDKKVSVEEMVDWLNNYVGQLLTYPHDQNRIDAIRAALLKLEEWGAIAVDINKKYHGGYGNLPASVGVLLRTIRDSGKRRRSDHDGG